MGKGRNRKFKNHKLQNHNRHPRRPQTRSIKRFLSKLMESRLKEQQRLYSQLWPNYILSGHLKEYKISKMAYSRSSRIASSRPQTSVFPASPQRIQNISNYSRGHGHDLSSRVDRDSGDPDFGFGFPLINRVTGSYSNGISFDDFSFRSVHSPSPSSPFQLSRSSDSDGDTRYESETSTDSLLSVDPHVSFPDDDDLDIIEVHVREDTSWLEKGPAAASNY